MPEIKGCNQSVNLDNLDIFTGQSFYTRYKEAQERKFPAYVLAFVESEEPTNGIYQKKISVYDGVSLYYFLQLNPPADRLNDPITRMPIKTVHYASIKCFEFVFKNDKSSILPTDESKLRLKSFLNDQLEEDGTHFIDSVNYLSPQTDCIRKIQYVVGAKLMASAVNRNDALVWLACSAITTNQGKAAFITSRQDGAQVLKDFLDLELLSNNIR
jgi:hypothetical protein